MKGFFYMANYKVEITGVNTSELLVLTREEQIALFQAYQNGDKEAKEKLIEGNLKLVLSVLRGYQNRNVNMDDLFQVGVIGLIKAIDNFDLKYELKLSTYAIPLILGEVKRYLRDNQSSLRVSRGTRDFAYQILKYKDQYRQEHGMEVSTKELVDYFQVSEYQISHALDSLKEPVSIFEPVYNDGGEAIYLFDEIADNTHQNEERDNYLLLKKSLMKLKEREKSIIMQRYLVGKTQMEIANCLSISQAQVSRIEKSAIKTLKRLMK